MNQLPENASQFAIVLAVLSPVAMAYITTRANRKQNASLEVVRDHVANTHPTNLRDDLDIIRDDVRGTRKDVGLLRDELREVRNRQSDFESSVREVVRRTHPEETLF